MRVTNSWSGCIPNSAELAKFEASILRLYDTQECGIAGIGRNMSGQHYAADGLHNYSFGRYERCYAGNGALAILIFADCQPRSDAVLLRLLQGTALASPGQLIRTAGQNSVKVSE